MVDSYARLIEAEIKKQKFGKQPPSLYEPIRYIMSLGGKRLRPLLTLLAYSLFRNDEKKVVPYACAVEAFHNFTLLHDDIMDNAPLRRGKPTVHEKWNVNTAILSGDVMLVKVYEMFLQLDSKLAKNVLTKFNACAAEVCEGQQWDMEFERMDTVSEKQYINMIRQKTAVLLGFSLELGAMLANAKTSDQKLLYHVGINVGIGFQLKDDLLDVYGDHSKFGKQVGGDIIANKKTFLLINALSMAGRDELTKLKQWLKNQGDPSAKVEAVKQLYDKLGIKELTEKKVNAYFKKGLTQLDSLSTSTRKKALLLNYINNLIDRQA